MKNRKLTYCNEEVFACALMPPEGMSPFDFPNLDLQLIEETYSNHTVLKVFDIKFQTDETVEAFLEALQDIIPKYLKLLGVKDQDMDPGLIQVATHIWGRSLFAFLEVLASFAGKESPVVLNKLGFKIQQFFAKPMGVLAEITQQFDNLSLVSRYAQSVMEKYTFHSFSCFMNELNVSPVWKEEILKERLEKLRMHLQVDGRTLQRNLDPYSLHPAYLLAQNRLKDVQDESVDLVSRFKNAVDGTLLKKKHIAAFLGISPTHISRILAGKPSKVQVLAAERLAQLLPASINESLQSKASRETIRKRANHFNKASESEKLALFRFRSSTSPLYSQRNMSETLAVYAKM